MEAETILERMADVYRSCRSYRDHGKVEFEHARYLGAPRVDTKPFTTLFARPDLLRFEYWDAPPADRPTRMVVWSDGDSAHRWWTLQPEIIQYSMVITADSGYPPYMVGHHGLNLAIAGATGVSDGSAHTVPRLLLPDVITGRAVTQMRHPRLLETETIGDTECLKIAGKYVGAPLTLWIGTYDWLIRKSLEVMRVLVTFGRQTTTYEPEIDVEIPREEFSFSPPGPADQ